MSILKVIHKRPFWTMAILTFFGMISILANMVYLSNTITEASAMQYAQSYLSSIDKFHSFYSSEIISRVKPQGITLRTDYKKDKTSVPYPATFSIDFSNHITESDPLVSTRLFSHYPFKLRKNGGVKNKYEKQAIMQFEKQNKTHNLKPYIDFENKNDKQFMHYAIPVIMQQGCVNCHNAHPESTKKDWKVGDVRGARMMTFPISSSLAMANKGWLMTLVMMITITTISLTFIFFIIRALKNSITALSETNQSIQRFVPNEFLKLLEKDSLLDVKLGDNLEKNMTVLFSDIRSFTKISESLSPRDNFNFLNAYLSRIGPVIRKHNGFIDKYIGDAVMALFVDPDDAVRAAIEMQLTLEEYNAYRLKKNRVPINVGVGLNTGNLRLGTIGETNRMEGTVISDSVNLAARIEGLTKMYSASLLISGNTYDAIKKIPTKHIRLIDKVIVKGKSEAVFVYEVLDGDALDTRYLKKKDIKIFNQATALFYKKDFKEAKNLFEQLLEKDAKDGPAKIFLERCIKHIKDGVDDNWTGTVKLDSK